MYLRFLIQLLDLRLGEIHDQCVSSILFACFGGVLSQRQGIDPTNG